ncbi:MAG: metallophosphoesterase family protein, partial [Limisphaerales bacterium]
MKYAIIADIHGNLEALQTVLKDAEANECTHYACLGDVVGPPHANEQAALQR